jgi:hypothetical protein
MDGRCVLLRPGDEMEGSAYVTPVEPKLATLPPGAKGRWFGERLEETLLARAGDPLPALDELPHLR